MLLKMIWDKKGIIFNPIDKLNWAHNSALQPTPIVFEDKIRVYFGSRDVNGVSRVGFFDCSKSNPSEIISWSKNPVLDIGEDGSFDDNGVVPTTVFNVGKEIWMYYAGYQLVNKVRFLVFSGLAISNDNGETFVKYSKVPILERTTNETLFRVIHSIIKKNDKYIVWYGGGSSFIKDSFKTYPVYDIRTMQSADGINFPKSGDIVIQNETDEYRLGRPYVVKLNDLYYMFFGASTKESPYRLQYATSIDLINWQRNKNDFGLFYDTDGYDSEMSAYPSVVDIDGNIWMFYNGNNYGYFGVGLAKLISF